MQLELRILFLKMTLLSSPFSNRTIKSFEITLNENKVNKYYLPFKGKLTRDLWIKIKAENSISYKL